MKAHYYTTLVDGRTIQGNILIKESAINRLVSFSVLLKVFKYASLWFDKKVDIEKNSKKAVLLFLWHNCIYINITHFSFHGIFIKDSLILWLFTCF